jgi:hypothetical protein
MQEIRQQHNVVTVAEIDVERAAFDQVMAVGDAELPGIFGRDLQNIRPVERVNLGILKVLSDDDAENSVTGGDVENF